MTAQSIADCGYTEINWIVVDGSDSESPDFVDDVFEKFGIQGSYHHLEGSTIYSGMNHGISQGEAPLTLILNEGDLLIPGSIKALIDSQGKKANGSLTIGAMIRKGDLLKPKRPDAGFFLHHYDIRHNNALIPRSLYLSLGLYEPSFEISAEHHWLKNAFSQGVTFNLVDHPIIVFETGGASDARSTKRQKAIAEDAQKSVSIYFPLVPKKLLEAIFFYRFEEAAIEQEHLASLVRASELDPKFAESLQAFLLHVWRNKRTNKSLSHQQFVFRCMLAHAVMKSDFPLLDVMGISHSDEKYFLHFVEEFSRKTETFVANSISSSSVAGKTEPIVICSKKNSLAESRFQGNVISLEELPLTLGDLSIKDCYLMFGDSRFQAVQFHFATWSFREPIFLNYFGEFVPTLVSMHGVDVRDLAESRIQRKNYINELNSLLKVRVTCPSLYLKKLISELGLPEEKIDVVGNPVTPWKTQFVDSRNTLSLINVGRSVRFKGHEILIQAIEDCVSKGLDVNLKIVLGEDAETRSARNLRRLIRRKKLDDKIQLIAFFDFHAGQRIEANAYISSSIYDDRSKRAETFGVANVEALLAGLPSIISKSGAQPEILSEIFKSRSDLESKVIFYESEDINELVKAVSALAQQLVSENNKVKSDDAQSNFNPFSPEQHSEKIKLSIALANQQEKMVLFASSLRGGAGKATLELADHLATKSTLSPKIVTANFETELVENRPVERISVKPSEHFSRFEGGSIISDTKMGLDALEIKVLCRGSKLNVIGWTRDLLSDEAIGFLSWMDTPLSIVVRDYHHLTGGCHYNQGCNQFLDNCSSCPQVREESEVLQVEQKLLYRSLKWNLKNITWISLSNHSKELIKDSALVSKGHLMVSPNPNFEALVKGNFDKRFLAKTQDDGVIRILFMPSSSGFTKGTDLFPPLAQEVQKMSKNLGLRLEFYTNEISSDLLSDHRVVSKKVPEGEINQVMSKTNVTLSLSRQETYSNTVVESLLVGTPVVAINTGVASDLKRVTNAVETFEELDGLSKVAERIINLAQMESFYFQKSLAKTVYPKTISETYELIASRPLAVKTGRSDLPESLKNWEFVYRNDSKRTSQNVSLKNYLNAIGRVEPYMLKRGIWQLFHEPSLFFRNLKLFVNRR